MTEKKRNETKRTRKPNASKVSLVPLFRFFPCFSSRNQRPKGQLTWNNPPPPLGLVANFSSSPARGGASATSTPTPDPVVDPRLSFLTLTGVALDFNPPPPPKTGLTGDSGCSTTLIVVEEEGVKLNARFVGEAAVVSSSSLVLLDGNSTFDLVASSFEGDPGLAGATIVVVGWKNPFLMGELGRSTNLDLEGDGGGTISLTSFFSPATAAATIPGKPTPLTYFLSGWKDLGSESTCSRYRLEEESSGERASPGRPVP